jgi:hypothetical protein
MSGIAGTARFDGHAATPSALFLLLTLVIAASFWTIPVVYEADKSPDGLVLFRQYGDPDYLPLVSATAHLKFGETSVKEYAGTGVRSFPYAPFVIHAMLYRVAGSVGFMLADILIVVLYACLLRRFMYIAGVSPVVAELLVLAAISSTLSWIVSKAEIIAHHPVPVKFWEFRFPRPSVTETAVVLFLVLATMLVARPERSAGWFALFGVSFSVVLQSDIYQAFIAAFVVSGVSIVVLVASSDRRAAVKRVLATAVAIGLASIPFAYQQLHTSSDLKQRWGVFSTGRYAALLPSSNTLVFVAVATLVAAGLALLYRNHDLKRGRIAALAVAALALVASVVTGPSSLAVIHQVIQIYHFEDRTERILGYVLLLFIGWALTDLLAAFGARKSSNRRLKAAGWAVGALFVGFCIFRAYKASSLNDMGNPTAPSMRPLSLLSYQTDFRELHDVLDRHAGASVLGTFDTQLANWWEYRGGYLYLPDLVNSTVPDQVVESRTCQFLRLLGASSEDFGHLLDNPYFVLRVAGMAKYQANSLFTPWPLSDYSDDARRRIAASAAGWNIEMPESESVRLIREYDRTEDPQRTNALDIIVLDRDALRPYVHPERSGRFQLAWSDRTFEVWERRNITLSGTPGTPAGLQAN